MALNINTSRLNDAIRRMASFMMQNKLGELSNERYMGAISEQDRLMRERAAEQDVRSRSLEEFKSKINIQDKIKEAFISTAKDNDAYTYNVRAGQVAEQAGDIAKAKSYYGRAFDLARPAVLAQFNALKGQVNENDLMASLEALGESGIEKTMTEAGQMSRAITSTGLEKSRQGLEGRRIALSEREQGLKEKEFVATGGGTKGGEKINQTITDAMNFLEPIARGDNVMTMMYKEPASYMNKQLSIIQQKLLSGAPLTDDDKKAISEARDFTGVIKKYSEKRLIGQPEYRSGQLEEETNAALEADKRAAQEAPPPPTAPAPQAAPVKVIPPNAPKAYNPTTGETAYWDGSQWIIVK